MSSPKKLILGIAGFKGSGKSLCTSYFISKGFKEVAFADPMKQFLYQVFPFSTEQLWGPSEMREIESEIVWNEIFDSYIENKLKLEDPFLGPFAVGALNAIYKKNRYQSCFFASPRSFLQTIGEWARSEINKDFWVNLTLNKIQSSMGDKFIISDIRHKNELKRVREVENPLAGYVIRVNRTEFWDANPDKDPRINADRHISEQEQLSISDTDFNCVLSMPEGKERVFEILDNMYDMIIENKMK